MARVDMFLTTHTSMMMGKDRSELWWKRTHFEVVPRTGDKVHIFYNREDAEWWFDHDIKQHWWEGDGTYHLSFRDVLVDPTEEDEKHNPITSYRYYTQWWTERDGSLTDRLFDNGWLTYSDAQKLGHVQ